LGDRPLLLLSFYHGSPAANRSFTSVHLRLLLRYLLLLSKNVGKAFGKNKMASGRSDRALQQDLVALPQTLKGT
jgi:hypothetical protein